jgi:thioredoxin
MRQVTSAEFDSEVLRAASPVVVDFFTQECGPCRAMSPVLAEWEQEAKGALRVIKVDVGAEPALASSCRVNGVPALLLFANGKCIGQTMGLKSKNTMKRWFDDAVKAAA